MKSSRKSTTEGHAVNGRLDGGKKMRKWRQMHEYKRREAGTNKGKVVVYFGVEKGGFRKDIKCKMFETFRSTFTNMEKVKARWHSVDEETLT